MIDRQTVFLVVDDFEPMRIVTSGQLRAMGARIIITAADGAEALRLLQNRRVDIVLSDWNMPIMTGLELLKAVRADEKISHLPFIMVTAEAERHRIEEAIASGVSDLLVKPYTANSLTSRVEKSLSLRHEYCLQPRKAPGQTHHEATQSSILKAIKTDISTAIRSSHGSPGQTILVVDDSADNLLLLSQLFKEEYRVRVAPGGERALEICQSNEPPDLVLLDIMMPGIDGFEVVKRMREHPTSAAIPVIFVTSSDDKDTRIKGLQLGAIDFVSKPIDPDVIKPRVHNFMRYVNLHSQLQASYDSMLELARLRENVEQITRHDMKGTLAGVIGLVQGLADDDSMNERQVRQLHMAEESALQALDMINLSSEIYKIETGCFKLNAKPVKIDYILRRLVEISRTTFAEKHLIVAIEADVPVGVEIPNVLGDAMFCYSLFQNLIKNACEAAPASSRVEVALFDETPLRIVINNNGAVPAEILDRFFEKFVTFGKQNGTGLGTYSAKLLTEAQNGTILLNTSVQSNQTTITVTLPRYFESMQ